MFSKIKYLPGKVFFDSSELTRYNNKEVLIKFSSGAKIIPLKFLMEINILAALNCFKQ